MNTDSENTIQPDYQDHTGIFFGGVIMGAIAGGILALWYAPRSGEESLNLILNRVGGVQSKIMNRVRGESIEESLQEGRALAHRYRARVAHRPGEPQP